MPNTFHVVIFSVPMIIPTAAVMIGCVGCHADPIAALASFWPTMKHNCLMKIKNPHNIKRKGETILSCDDGTYMNAHIVRIGPAHASRMVAKSTCRYVRFERRRRSSES